MRSRDKSMVPGQLALGVALFCVAAQASAATLDKAFLPASIASGASTTLTFTVTHPAGQPVLANVGFVDQLPAGLVIATSAGVGGTCSNAAAATTATSGTATITVASQNVPAGAASRTVTVNVANATGQFNPGCGGNPASFTNSSSDERRAKIIHAEGELQAPDKLLQAAQMLAKAPQAMQLRYLRTLGIIASDKSTTIVFPLPMDLLSALKGIGTGGT